MKPSELAKQHGINLTDIGLMIGKPTATLRNWYRDNPKLFKAVIIGCAIIKKETDKNKMQSNLYLSAVDVLTNQEY